MTVLASAVESAATVAARAVAEAGVIVQEPQSAADTERAADLLGQVWSTPELPVPASVLRAVQHAGGYVFGAYDSSDGLLGVSVGLLASDGLHSHITGVLPAGQRRGLGLALKQHQRAWSLERGLTTISWTCDPLVRRNMTFNLHALGASVAEYLPDHYGIMNDGVNGGDETDRFEMRWDLLSPPALEATHARRPWVDAHFADAISIDAQGRPVSSKARGSCLVQLPPDIEAIRRQEPALGRAWRLAVRNAVLSAFSEGAVVQGLTATGALVLEVPQ